MRWVITHVRPLETLKGRAGFAHGASWRVGAASARWAKPNRHGLVG
jgi:hypothetical protein